VEQYLERRSEPGESPPSPPSQSAGATPGAVLRAARKEIRRIEAALDKVQTREMSLHDEIAMNSSDHVRLSLLNTQLDALSAEREQLETGWLDASETLE
jgi:ATP-binding cassette subfamily F protein uup